MTQNRINMNIKQRSVPQAQQNAIKIQPTNLTAQQKPQKLQHFQIKQTQSGAVPQSQTALNTCQNNQNFQSLASQAVQSIQGVNSHFRLETQPATNLSPLTLSSPKSILPQKSDKFVQQVMCERVSLAGSGSAASGSERHKQLQVPSHPLQQSVGKLNAHDLQRLGSSPQTIRFTSQLAAKQQDLNNHNNVVSGQVALTPQKSSGKVVNQLLLSNKIKNQNGASGPQSAYQTALSRKDRMIQPSKKRMSQPVATEPDQDHQELILMHQEALERQSGRGPVSPRQKKTTLHSPPKTKTLIQNNQPSNSTKRLQGSASESYLRVVNQPQKLQHQAQNQQGQPPVSTLQQPSIAQPKQQAFDMQFDRNVLQSLEAVACKQRQKAQVVSRTKLDRGAIVTTKQKTAVGSTGAELTQEGSEMGLPIQTNKLVTLSMSSILSKQPSTQSRRKQNMQLRNLNHSPKETKLASIFERIRPWNCTICQPKTAPARQVDRNLMKMSRKLLGDQVCRFMIKNEFYDSRKVLELLNTHSRSNLVALFKDYLIFDDIYEFLTAIYTVRDSLQILTRHAKFYDSLKDISVLTQYRESQIRDRHLILHGLKPCFANQDREIQALLATNAAYKLRLVIQKVRRMQVAKGLRQKAKQDLDCSSDEEEEEVEQEVKSPQKGKKVRKSADDFRSSPQKQKPMNRRKAKDMLKLSFERLVQSSLVVPYNFEVSQSGLLQPRQTNSDKFKQMKFAGDFKTNGTIDFTNISLDKEVEIVLGTSQIDYDFTQASQNLAHFGISESRVGYYAEAVNPASATANTKSVIDNEKIRQVESMYMNAQIILDDLSSRPLTRQGGCTGGADSNKNQRSSQPASHQRIFELHRQTPLACQQQQNVEEFKSHLPFCLPPPSKLGGTNQESIEDCVEKEALEKARKGQFTAVNEDESSFEKRKEVKIEEIDECANDHQNLIQIINDASMSKNRTPFVEEKIHTPKGIAKKREQRNMSDDSTEFAKRSADLALRALPNSEEPQNNFDPNQRVKPEIVDHQTQAKTHRGLIPNQNTANKRQNRQTKQSTLDQQQNNDQIIGVQKLNDAISKAIVDDRKRTVDQKERSYLQQKQPQTSNERSRNTQTASNANTIADKQIWSDAPAQRIINQGERIERVKKHATPRSPHQQMALRFTNDFVKPPGTQTGSIQNEQQVVVQKQSEQQLSLPQKSRKLGERKASMVSSNSKTALSQGKRRPSKDRNGKQQKVIVNNNQGSKVVNHQQERQLVLNSQEGKPLVLSKRIIAHLEASLSERNLLSARDRCDSETINSGALERPQVQLESNNRHTISKRAVKALLSPKFLSRNNLQMQEMDGGPEEIAKTFNIATIPSTMGTSSVQQQEQQDSKAKDSLLMNSKFGISKTLGRLQKRLASTSDLQDGTIPHRFKSPKMSTQLQPISAVKQQTQQQVQLYQKKQVMGGSKGSYFSKHLRNENHNVLVISPKKAQESLKNKQQILQIPAKNSLIKKHQVAASKLKKPINLQQPQLLGKTQSFRNEAQMQYSSMTDLQTIANKLKLLGQPNQKKHLEVGNEKQFLTRKHSVRGGFKGLDKETSETLSSFECQTNSQFTAQSAQKTRSVKKQRVISDNMSSKYGAESSHEESKPHANLPQNQLMNKQQVLLSPPNQQEYYTRQAVQVQRQKGVQTHRNVSSAGSSHSTNQTSALPQSSSSLTTKKMVKSISTDKMRAQQMLNIKQAASKNATIQQKQITSINNPTISSTTANLLQDQQLSSRNLSQNKHTKSSAALVYQSDIVSMRKQLRELQTARIKKSQQQGASRSPRAAYEENTTGKDKQTDRLNQVNQKQHNLKVSRLTARQQSQQQQDDLMVDNDSSSKPQSKIRNRSREVNILTLNKKLGSGTLTGKKQSLNVDDLDKLTFADKQQKASVNTRANSRKQNQQAHQQIVSNREIANLVLNNFGQTTQPTTKTPLSPLSSQANSGLNQKKYAAGVSNATQAGLSARVVQQAKNATKLGQLQQTSGSANVTNHTPSLSQKPSSFANKVEYSTSAKRTTNLVASHPIANQDNIIISVPQNQINQNVAAAVGPLINLGVKNNQSSSLSKQGLHKRKTSMVYQMSNNIDYTNQLGGHKQLLHVQQAQQTTHSLLNHRFQSTQNLKEQEEQVFLGVASRVSNQKSVNSLIKATATNNGSSGGVLASQKVVNSKSFAPQPQNPTSSLLNQERRVGSQVNLGLVSSTQVQAQAQAQQQVVMIKGSKKGNLNSGNTQQQQTIGQGGGVLKKSSSSKKTKQQIN